MKVVAVVITLEAIPIGVLIGGAWGCPLPRRSRFWPRVLGVLVAMLVPDLMAAALRPGEETTGMLVFLGLPWGLLLAGLSRLLLFHRPGPESGPGEDGGDGPGPEDRRPNPPRPILGVPLPDAEPSSTRLRDHRPTRRSSRPRRPARV